MSDSIGPMPITGQARELRDVWIQKAREYVLEVSERNTYDPVMRKIVEELLAEIDERGQRIERDAWRGFN